MGDKLHFAAHSHHLWPDCLESAHNQYLQDSYRLADEKWGKAVSQIESDCKEKLARLLDLSDPNQICFAPNVHSLLFRLISCFDLRKPLRILSTDSEFYSFSRQALRLEEYDNISVNRVPVLPFSDFEEHFMEEAKSGKYQMIYISQVFFNSGLAIDFIDRLAHIAPAQTMVVIDGYHGCGAIPTSIKKTENRIFYLAGGYKYLQSGEGVCFMTVPASASQYRPLYTGWFAEFDSLDAHEEAVNYAPDARRFLGATTDPSGIYRMNAVLSNWEKEGITVSKIHQHIQSLQSYFIERLKTQDIFGLTKSDLIHKQEGTASIGHFLTFRTEKALEIHQKLRVQNILTDCREDRLRFGFGVYHDMEAINNLFEKL